MNEVEKAKRNAADTGGDMRLARQLRAAEDRDRDADEREALADERDKLADEREQASDEAEATMRQHVPGSAQATLEALVANTAARASNENDRHAQADRSALAASPPAPDWDLDKRGFVGDHRQYQADLRELIADERERLADLREEILRNLATSTDPDAEWRLSLHDLFSTNDDRVERSVHRAARAQAKRARQLAEQEMAISRRSAFAAELVAVARALVHTDTVDGALQEILYTCIRAVGGCDDATFSMVGPGGHVATPASVDPGSPGLALDLAQYQARQGPSLDAIANESIAISSDISADTRWPDLLPQIVGTPCRSVLSVPVIDERRQVPLGALNHYSLSVDGFTASDAECAVLLAAHLGAVMTLAIDAASAGRRLVELGHAVQSRDVIGQAKGILMERQRLTADQAFDVLRRASQRLNRKLVEIADELAATGAITTELD